MLLDDIDRMDALELATLDKKLGLSKQTETFEQTSIRLLMNGQDEEAYIYARMSERGRKIILRKIKEGSL
jgi:hypothetical protein